MIEIIKYFAAFIVSALFVYFIGSILLGFTNISPADRQKRFQRLFYSMVIGLISIVWIYSIIKARGVSVSTIGLMLTVFMFFYNYRIGAFRFQKGRLQLQELYSSLPFFLTMGIIIFLFYSLSVVSFKEFPFYVPDPDYFYYSDISTYLRLTGQENTFQYTNQLFPIVHGIAPYHYFELWLNALIAGITHQVPVITILLVTYPLLAIIVLTGVLAIAEHFITVRALHWVLCFLLLFISGVFLNIYLKFSLLEDSYASVHSQPFAIYGRKLLPLYVCSLLFMQFWLNNSRINAVLVLLLLPAFNASTFPGIVTGTGTFALFRIILKKNSWPEFILLSGAIVSTGLAFMLLFHLFQPEASGVFKISKLEGFMSGEPISIMAIKKYVFSTLFPFMRVFIYYAPFVFLAIVLAWKGSGTPKGLAGALPLILYLLISGLLLSALFHVEDAGQIFSNLLPIVNCWLISFFLYHLSQMLKFGAKTSVQSKWVGLLLLVLIANNIWSTFQSISYCKAHWVPRYSVEFLSAVKAEFDKAPITYNVGSLLPDQLYQKYTAEYYSNNNRGYYVKVISGDAELVNLNATNAEKFMSSYTAYDSLRYFAQPLVMLRQVKGSTVQYNMQELIKTFNIGYIALAKGETPGPALDSIVINEIEDSLSGERFYTLQ